METKSSGAATRTSTIPSRLALRLKVLESSSAEHVLLTYHSILFPSSHAATTHDGLRVYGLKTLNPKP